MVVRVKLEPDCFGQKPPEKCCFCSKPTRYWVPSKEVPCCPKCASVRKLGQVPSKVEWLQRETCE